METKYTIHYPGKKDSHQAGGNMNYLKIFGICLLIAFGVIAVYVYLSYQHDIVQPVSAYHQAAKLLILPAGQ